MYTVQISSYASRITKKYRGTVKEDFDKVVEKLKKDPFQQSLKTHKLTGKLSEHYACSMNYKDRVVFLVIIDKKILITDVGSHDQVY